MSADMISKKCRVVIAGHDRPTYVEKWSKVGETPFKKRKWTASRRTQFYDLYYFHSIFPSSTEHFSYISEFLWHETE